MMFYEFRDPRAIAAGIEMALVAENGNVEFLF
jgi:hypothetical protein